jgi:hypothetical protein
MTRCEGKHDLIRTKTAGHSWKERIAPMLRNLLSALFLAAIASAPCMGQGQQKYQLPDIRSLKHLTTSQSEHAADIPGKETTMDFYSAPNGQVITLYSYRNRPVGFSTHSNSDVQNTYRIFLDLTGEGLYQEVDRSQPWQLPPWVKQMR